MSRYSIGFQRCPFGNSPPTGVIGDSASGWGQHWKPNGVTGWRRNTPGRCDARQIFAHRVVRDAQLPRNRPRRGTSTEMQCHQPPYPPHGQPLGRHLSLHRLRWSTGRQLDADLRNATLLPVAPFFRQRWTASSERWAASIQNTGRHQFTMLDAISSERLDSLPQNRMPTVATV
jgi:hypothetical protein